VILKEGAINKQNKIVKITHQLVIASSCHIIFQTAAFLTSLLTVNSYLLLLAVERMLEPPRLPLD
jgi:hypothetical protein